ncbi:13969_t:CDS:2 [Gigaspora margarita]|uniref:13969_t:CDS:1 n=1 Tax=Gigaspora margarita TaxID=4874 RepID=A0ABM8VZ45_GIGMA|nr:13969_t:CDS:2 [Gigaspora margarita]
MDNYEDVDRVLLKKKWSLAFKLCLKESTNQHLLECLSNDATYFIEEMKDYNDLFFVENVEGNKVNEVWNEAINSLSGKPFSTKHQIIEFIIREVYNASFLNIDESIYLLERLQNAENNVLNKNLNIYKIDFMWNIIIEKFYEETFSTDQQVLEFFEQFKTGINHLNYTENLFFIARLENAFTLCSIRNFLTPQQAFLKLDKGKIDFMWNIVCRMLVKRIFVSIDQVSEFSKFAKYTPQIYIDLATQCMNADAMKRPSAKELCEILDFWMKDDESIKIYEKSNKIMLETFLNKLTDNAKQDPVKFIELYKQWLNLYQMVQVDRHYLKEQEFWEIYKLLTKDMKIYEEPNKIIYESSVIKRQLIDGLFLPTPINSIEISEFDLNKFKPDTNASINLHKSNFRSTEIYQQELVSSLCFNLNILERHELDEDNLTNDVGFIQGVLNSESSYQTGGILILVGFLLLRITYYAGSDKRKVGLLSYLISEIELVGSIKFDKFIEFVNEAENNSVEPRFEIKHYTNEKGKKKKQEAQFN